jgi:stage II sporulation protein E
LSILLLPVAGLITGYVKERRYVVSAVVFVVTDVMLSVFTGISQGELSSLINIVCGAFVFTVLAPFYSDRWLITEGSESNALPELMNARMSFLSDSIGSVRSESGRIAELLLDKADARLFRL